MNDEITVQDGFVFGPRSRPANPYLKVSGSIHDNVMAESLGFPGHGERKHPRGAVSAPVA